MNVVSAAFLGISDMYQGPDGWMVERKEGYLVDVDGVLEVLHVLFVGGDVEEGGARLGALDGEGGAARSERHRRVEAAAVAGVVVAVAAVQRRVQHGPVVLAQRHLSSTTSTIINKPLADSIQHDFPRFLRSLQVGSQTRGSRPQRGVV